MASETKLVQMRLRKETLNKLDNMSDLLKIDNKTQIIASSIILTEELVKNMVENDAKVYIHYKDGSKSEIFIIKELQILESQRL